MQMYEMQLDHDPDIAIIDITVLNRSIWQNDFNRPIWQNDFNRLI